jgi:hypothetical protein
MSDDIKERLAALERELEKQDEEWERVKENLGAMGDVRVAVCDELLEEIDEALQTRASPYQVTALSRA